MSEKKYDVTALGELLIDFTENGLSEQGNPLLEANPGGAPCNVLSMLQNLGRKTAFIGKVGNDGFGKMLRKTIEEQGICSDGLMLDDEVHTTLALVLKKEDGDRDFAFYRKPGADMMLREEEVNEELIINSKVFHFGSLSFTDEPVRSASLKALELAKKSGAIISFDPNLREPLWNDLKEAKKQIAAGMKYADIVKISDNEILWFTNEDDYDNAISKLRNDYPNLRLICLSLGPEGSRAYYNDIVVKQKAFLREDTVDTTGAGDTLCAYMINTVLENGLDNLDEYSLKEMLRKGNAAASIITTRKGALKVMPDVAETDDFLSFLG